MSDADKNVIPSILDRLTPGGPSRDGQSLRDLKEGVRRDLENLLNTRWRCASWPPDLDQLEVSLVNYGLPDFTGTNFAADSDQHKLRSITEQIIRAFEPRFKHVTVSIQKNESDIDRTIRFRIEGVLYADPAPEPVVFNSTLEPTTGAFDVSGTRR